MKLEDLLQLSQRFGVVQMCAQTEDAGDVKFIIEPERAVSSKSPVVEGDEDDPSIGEQQRAPPRVGNDGLTAEQQDELYGRPHSDTKG